VRWISTVALQANLRGIDGGGFGANSSEGRAWIREVRTPEGGPNALGGANT
jgi:hypothetical protein